MSDEEEIVFKGNALYSHLIDQGYTDFETYKPNSLDTEGYANDNVINKIYSTKLTDEPKYSNDETIILSSHDANLLKSILSCQLLFKEDADLLEAVTSSGHVEEKKTNLYYYFGAVLAGLFTTVVTFKKGLNIWLPAGITLLTTIYSSLSFVKEYQEIQHYNLLQSHVVKLQEMCSSIHRLLRFLKETEILSTNQVSIHNVGAAMYMPTQIREMKDLATLPSWKSMPNLRKHLMGALLEIINLLSLSCESLRQLSPSWLSESDQISLRESLVSNGVLSGSDQVLTIKNLQLINEIYLVVQSEYLRRIALNLSPMIWGNSKILKGRTKKGQLLLTVHLK
uniref:Uncharacterized protein n=1 Tax=Homalodisca liturata TaxID=320908 RepID=A0A1B6HHJ3_9HEMI